MIPTVVCWSNCFWVALCLGLLAVVALELLAGDPGIRAGIPGEPSAVHPSDPAEPEAIEFHPPPPSIIDIVAARPLFSPSRRPYVTPVGASDVEDVAFELIAVLLTESRRAALVRIEAQEQPVWVHERDWLSSWQLEKILPDRLRLHRRNEVRIVNLRSGLAGESVTITPLKLVENQN
jgi:hypothetical protein